MSQAVAEQPAVAPEQSTIPQKIPQAAALALLGNIGQDLPPEVRKNFVEAATYEGVFHPNIFGSASHALDCHQRGIPYGHFPGSDSRPLLSERVPPKTDPNS